MAKTLAEELRENRDLPDEGLRTLLEGDDPSTGREAREVTRAVFGGKVWLRALIEWSNVCRNDCLYCGIRRSNGRIRRYSLSREEILSCCAQAWSLGLRTFVLQGGENPAAARQLTDTVAAIRAAWPSAAITLSLGELPRETLRLLREAGADRYLLRHETATASHYASLHPAGMQLQTRLDCLHTLRELGFQTGMGMMVGSPGQTTEHLIADIRLMQAFRPEMIGIGPFIPQKDTPFAGETAGSAEKTLRLYSILRLMFPSANIPSTTALSTLLPGGRIAGLRAGANVIMPDFTPAPYREAYTLYDGKNAACVETGAQLQALQQELSAAGYTVSSTRGDYQHHV